jgi:hypothetical protein
MRLLVLTLDETVFDGSIEEVVVPLADAPRPVSGPDARR